MEELRIPEHHYPGLKALFALSPEAAATLLSVLAKATPTLGPREFTASLPAKVEGVAPKDLTQIVRVLLAMYSVRARREQDIGSFVIDILEALKQLKDFAIVASKQETEAEARLSVFLGLESLSITSKAAYILSEQQYIYCSGRILTDARPIFKDDPTEPPNHALVYHILRVHYHEVSELKEVYFAMSDADLEKLSRQLARAVAKSTTLRETLAKVGIQSLEVE